MSLTELSNAENDSFNLDKPRMSKTEMRLVACDEDDGWCLAGDDGPVSPKDNPAELVFISNSLSRRVLVKADRVSRLVQPFRESLLTVVFLLLLFIERLNENNADSSPPTP